MSVLGYIVFALYMAGILGIGLFHFRRNQSAGDYYVGGRSVPPLALGLSIVAGGITVNLLPWLDGKLPDGLQRIFFGLGLWPVVYGLVVSAIIFVMVSLLAKKPYASHFDDTPEKID